MRTSAGADEFLNTARKLWSKVCIKQLAKNSNLGSNFIVVVYLRVSKEAMKISYFTSNTNASQYLVGKS